MSAGPAVNETARGILATALASRRGCLATLGRDGAPHLVPVTFAQTGDALALVVDGKPKRGGELRRVRNIKHDPRVCLLFDRYEEDWTTLWWARLDGDARVHEFDDAVRDAAADSLAAKYPQYLQDPPRGELVLVAVRRVVVWSHTLGRAVEFAP